MWRVDHHTADVRIHVEAPALEELFADAVRALTEVMHPVGSGAPIASPVDLQANDVSALLVDFLNDVLTRAHIERAAFTDVRFELLRETALRATISGIHVETFEEDVKSVTYHDAHVARLDDDWTVTLVLDI
jgi:SHS2 domain-containing protein